MDFGAFPPEVNSARMYAGPGSAPMLAAASAWAGLGAELRSAAAGYQSEIVRLTGEGWTGPASRAMAAAAAPYAAWLNTTAGQAEQTATQAKAASAAYEAAFAMTVPPATIAANRAQLAALVATNFLGQNASAIAATEAHYGSMWAQDAAAMYGYAADSAAASKLTPFTASPRTANPAAQSTSDAQSALSQAITATPNTLQGLASPLQTGSPPSLIDGIAALLGIQPGDLSNALTNLSSSTMSPMSVAAMSQVGADAAIIHSVANGGVVGPLGGVIPGWGGIPGGISPSLLPPGWGISSVTPPNPLGMTGVVSQASPVGAMGRAGLVGALSVPQSWTAAMPAPPPAAGASLVSSWAAAPPAEPAGMPGMPGMPLAGSGAGRGYGFAAPRYGFKPTVMARPVIAG